jgi:hypothetical protein
LCDAQPSVSLDVFKSLGEAVRSSYNTVCGAAARVIGSDVMTDEEEQALRAKLAQLRQEHGDLDAAISAMTTATACDQLQLTRLKKRKLQLKDQIARIEDSLLPDITA